jgi:hypothetical protein
MQARWPSLVRCFDDGRLALDNNPAERAPRGGALGRLFRIAVARFSAFRQFLVLERHVSQVLSKGRCNNVLR